MQVVAGGFGSAHIDGGGTEDLFRTQTVTVTGGSGVNAFYSMNATTYWLAQGDGSSRVWADEYEEGCSYATYICLENGANHHACMTAQATCELIVENSLANCDQVFTMIWPDSTIAFIRNGDVIEIRPGR